MKSIYIALALTACTAGAAFAVDVVAPSQVTTLHQDLIGYHSYTIEWTNTGDDCDTGNATTYEVWQSTSAITDINWQSATKIDSGTADNNGVETCLGFTVSCPGTQYYYAVFLLDAAGNRSPISNVILTGPRCATPLTEVDCSY